MKVKMGFFKCMESMARDMRHPYIPSSLVPRLPLLRAHNVLRMTFDPTEKSGVGAWYILAREQRVR